MRTYKGNIYQLPYNGVFVFGSNTQGRHGMGSARIALDKFGAIYGQSRGLQGKSYAICTKNLTKKIHPSVSSDEICSQIYELYNFALCNPNLDFYVVYSGSGSNLNAYTSQQLADMFSSWLHIFPIPKNIIFEEEFFKLLKHI